MILVTVTSAVLGVSYLTHVIHTYTHTYIASSIIGRLCSHGRSAKSRWGLTRGRGMNEDHRLVCLLGMTACFLVTLSQQTFTGVQVQWIIQRRGQH